MEGARSTFSQELRPTRKHDHTLPIWLHRKQRQSGNARMGQQRCVGNKPSHLGEGWC